MEEQMLVQVIQEEAPWEKLSKRLKSYVGSQENYHLRTKELCIRKRLRWSDCAARKVCKEGEYYEDLMRYLRKRQGLFPYHLADYVCRVLRISSFRYYCDLVYEVMQQERSYDSIPNFSAADALRETGIGRNQFIDIMNKTRSKLMWKFSKSVVRELLPSHPVEFPLESWWHVCAVNLTNEEYRKLSEEEMVVMERAGRQADESVTLVGEFDVSLLHGLYRRGLIYFLVPVYPHDRFQVASLEGFVSNRNQQYEDYTEELLYSLFVASSEHSTVEDLAGTLQADIHQLEAAVSLACRLGWAQKVIDPATYLLTPGSPVLGQSDDDGDEWIASVRRDGPPDGEIGQVVAADGQLGQGKKGNRVALMVDANITSYLMMGSFSHALKQNAVTLYEAGKLSGRAVSELCEELRSLATTPLEGELQRFADHAFSLRYVLECLRTQGSGGSIRRASESELEATVEQAPGRSEELSEPGDQTGQSPAPGANWAKGAGSVGTSNDSSGTGKELLVRRVLDLDLERVGQPSEAGKEPESMARLHALGESSGKHAADAAHKEHGRLSTGDGPAEASQDAHSKEPILQVGPPVGVDDEFQEWQAADASGEAPQMGSANLYGGVESLWSDLNSLSGAPRGAPADVRSRPSSPGIGNSSASQRPWNARELPAFQSLAPGSAAGELSLTGTLNLMDIDPEVSPKLSGEAFTTDLEDSPQVDKPESSKKQPGGKRVNRQVDILRCESLAGLPAGTLRRVLQRDYSVIVSVVPLVAPLSVTSPRGEGPVHLGPPSPAAITPWMKLLLYSTAGAGPVTIALVRGQRFRQLPPPLRGCKLALVWSWDAQIVGGVGGKVEGSSVSGTLLLHILNSLLRHSAVLVQPFGLGAANLDSASGAPVTCNIALPLPQGDSVPADFPQSSLGSDFARSGKGWSVGSKGSPETQPEGQKPSTGFPDVSFWLSHRGVQAAVKELGLQTVGYLRMIRIAPQDAKVQSHGPKAALHNPSDEFEWVPHNVEFGVPLFDPELCRQVCEGAVVADMFSSASLSSQRSAMLALRQRLRNFISDFKANGPVARAAFYKDRSLLHMASSICTDTWADPEVLESSPADSSPGSGASSTPYLTRQHSDIFELRLMSRGRVEQMQKMETRNTGSSLSSPAPALGRGQQPAAPLRETGEDEAELVEVTLPGLNLLFDGYMLQPYDVSVWLQGRLPAALIACEQDVSAGFLKMLP